MKRLSYMAVSALLVLGLASCEKKERVKETQSSVEKRDMVFIAASDNGGMKTTVKPDGTTVVWSATDKIRVFTADDTQGSECDLTSGAGTATAEFAGQCAIDGPWTAICPSSAVTGISDGIITLTMPETQEYAENTFAAGAMPCVAYSDRTILNFRHSFGVLKLSFKLTKGTTGSVKSITVTDRGGAKLNGTFTVKPSSSAVATYGTGGTSSITLNCPDVPLSTDTVTNFWIVVPQGAFESGFDVTITSTDDIETVLSTQKANTITAGEVNKMPLQIIEFEFGKGYAEVKAEAGIPDNKVKWIQLWVNGPKFAEFNVGATSIKEYGGYYAWAGYHNDDTAINLWGSNWRMLTKADFDKLFSKCSVQWVTNYKGIGKNGLLFTGEDAGYTENSVFFPAAGYYNMGIVNGADKTGYYWSSTDSSRDYAYGMFFNSYSQKVSPYNSSYGYSVRAVLYERMSTGSSTESVDILQ